MEFYDSEYMENIISLLRGNYDDVEFIVFANANEPTEQDRLALSEYILNQFGLSAKFREVGEHTVESALKAFRAMVGNSGEYDFDITGGSTVFIAAAGALAVENGGKRIFLHEYDPATGKRTFSYPKNSPTIGTKKGKLTVDYVLALRSIERRNKDHATRYCLDQDDLRGEVVRLWNTVRSDLKGWNAFCSGADVTPKRDYLAVIKTIDKDKRKKCGRLLNKLEKGGIISHPDEKPVGDKVQLSYNLYVPESAQFLYDKAGNILEMLTYVAVVDSGRFTDCCTGIFLDWDDSNRRKEEGPHNEIDTVMTRGHIPYFVSCKNTAVNNSFMYEIMVMARHYGGKYAIPGLVCTTKCTGADYLRAKEMGVVLIDDIASMSISEYSQKLISAFGGQ